MKTSSESKKTRKPNGKPGNAGSARGDAGPEATAEIAAAGAPPKPAKIGNKAYARELARLQVELVKLQEWIKHEGLKVVVVFEGRDAAGKGGVIKRITQMLNPRICRVVALSTPTEREKTQWYVVEADVKKRARLNCISHLLSMIPYEDMTPEAIVLPPRVAETSYVRPPISDQTFVPEVL